MIEMVSRQPDLIEGAKKRVVFLLVERQGRYFIVPMAAG
jgi:hypothetical protein